MHADSHSDRCVPPPAAWALTRDEWLPTAVSSVKFEVAVGPPAASEARHLVLDALGVLLGPIERSNLELLISELVTNCVRHAGMAEGTDQIKVHAAVAPERLRIEVCDTGEGFTPGAARIRSYEAGDGGLGLVLLDRLSAVWGVATGDGVCVWAEFDRDGEELL